MTVRPLQAEVYAWLNKSLCVESGVKPFRTYRNGKQPVNETNLITPPASAVKWKDAGPQLSHKINANKMHTEIDTHFTILAMSDALKY